MVVKELEAVEFDSIDIHKFGNNIEISGMLLANGNEVYIIPFTDLDFLQMENIICIDDMDKESWNKLLFQLDHLEVIVRARDEDGKLQKIVLRKSQRQIDTVIQWNVFRRDFYTCQYCGRNDVPLTIDHIIRWENMGQTHEDNLISACRKCNKTRGNMEFENWLECDYYLKGTNKNSTRDRINRHHFEDAKNLPLRKFERSR